MKSDQVQAAHECVKLSAAGKIGFGEVVGRLMNCGIESYHADYSRMETTFYAPNSSSCVVPMEHETSQIAEVFSAGQIEAAVRKAQRGDVQYLEFTRLVLAAGSVGYFVQMSGKCVQYFGRRGDIHTEWFPGADGARPFEG